VPVSVAAGFVCGKIVKPVKEVVTVVIPLVILN
jgi:hypothetical protein